MRGGGLLCGLVVILAASTAALAAPETSHRPQPKLPGIAGDATLTRSLRQEMTRLGQTYKPRTHHFIQPNVPKYVNRLILENSPYLLQHAHNPVNWYPWGVV